MGDMAAESEPLLAGVNSPCDMDLLGASGSILGTNGRGRLLSEDVFGIALPEDICIGSGSMAKGIANTIDCQVRRDTNGVQDMRGSPWLHTCEAIRCKGTSTSHVEHLMCGTKLGARREWFISP